MIWYILSAIPLREPYHLSSAQKKLSRPLQAQQRVGETEQPLLPASISYITAHVGHVPQSTSDDLNFHWKTCHRVATRWMHHSSFGTVPWYNVTSYWDLLCNSKWASRANLCADLFPTFAWCHATLSAPCNTVCLRQYASRTCTCIHSHQQMSTAFWSCFWLWETSLQQQCVWS